MRPLKLRYVAPRSEGNDDFRSRALIRIIFRKPAANVVGSHSDNRIRFGVVIERSVEQFGAKEPLCQTVEIAIKRAGDDVLEEVIASSASLEQRACQYSLQFKPHCLHFLRSKGDSRSCVFGRHKAFFDG
jgi:hypothetical protein